MKEGVRAQGGVESCICESEEFSLKGKEILTDLENIRRRILDNEWKRNKMKLSRSLSWIRNGTVRNDMFVRDRKDQVNELA